ncbi:MAG: hypothetical protein JNK78_07140 [Planctomycetes bacterium]|nr:hypothetical protein [Planctomycetota bacterium]
MSRSFFPSCLCLAAASLSAQTYLALPAQSDTTAELGSYSLVPFMQPDARVQMFFDASEVGASTFVADQLSLRYDGPIPAVGAPGPFSISRLHIRIGTTEIAVPGADFAANLTQPLTTARDGAWTYLPDPGSANPHPWGGPNGSLQFDFTLPVAVAIPPGGWLVVDITMEGNNISSFGFAHAILDGTTTSGGVQNGSATTLGIGCSAAIGQPAATITPSGTYAPGAAHQLAGQNLGANALALTIFGITNPAATLPGTTCTVYVDPIIFKVVVTDGAGSFGTEQPGASLAMPADNAFAGLVIYEQAVSLIDGANAFGLVTSNAVEVSLGSFATPGRGIYTVAHDTDSAASVANSVKPFGFAVRLRTL